MTENHKKALCCVEGKTWLELRPLMDLWIMGLLYMLIVCGSRLCGAFGEKGLVRSVCPTGEMCGRSPACLDTGTNKRWVWEI